MDFRIIRYLDITGVIEVRTGMIRSVLLKNRKNKFWYGLRGAGKGAVWLKQRATKGKCELT